MSDRVWLRGRRILFHWLQDRSRNSCEKQHSHSWDVPASTSQDLHSSHETSQEKRRLFPRTSHEVPLLLLVFIAAILPLRIKRDISTSFSESKDSRPEDVSTTLDHYHATFIIEVLKPRLKVLLTDQLQLRNVQPAVADMALHPISPQSTSRNGSGGGGGGGVLSLLLRAFLAAAVGWNATSRAAWPLKTTLYMSNHIRYVSKSTGLTAGG